MYYTNSREYLRHVGPPPSPRKVGRDVRRILAMVGKAPLNREVILPGTHKHSFETSDPVQNARIERARRA